MNSLYGLRVDIRVEFGPGSDRRGKFPDERGCQERERGVKFSYSVLNRKLMGGNKYSGGTKEFI